MYLISSVSHGGDGVFRFDLESGDRETLVPGRFRGITAGPDGWHYAVTGSRRQERGVETHIFRFKPETREVEDLGPFAWRGCHDLRWYGDGFYLVASVGNYIVKLNERLEQVDHMQIVEDARDVCHVNCLGHHNGSLYASVFTLSPGPRSEKRMTSAWTTEGKVLKIDFAARRWEIFWEPLAQPHSLLWAPDGLYIVESHTSRITRINPEQGRAQTVRKFHGFLRGLSQEGDRLVLGVTEMFYEKRQRSAHLPLFTRLMERFRPFAGVLVLDRQSGRTLKSYRMEGTEIYDIVPLRTAPSGAAASPGLLSDTGRPTPHGRHRGCERVG